MVKTALRERFSTVLYTRRKFHSAGSPYTAPTHFVIKLHEGKHYDSQTLPVIAPRGEGNNREIKAQVSMSFSIFVSPKTQNSGKCSVTINYGLPGCHGRSHIPFPDS